MMAILVVKKADNTTVSLPAPQELQWQISDLDADGTGRNQNGDMFRDRVAVKRKISVKWPPLSKSDAATLLQAVEDPFFQLTYPDAKTGANRTMWCYCGDRTAPALRLTSDGQWLWGNITFNFIEK